MSRPVLLRAEPEPPLEPDGAAIGRRVLEELENVVRDGRTGAADTLAATLRRLLDAEDNLRAKGPDSDTTERQLRVAIANEQERAAATACS